VTNIYSKYQTALLKRKIDNWFVVGPVKNIGRASKISTFNLHVCHGVWWSAGGGRQTKEAKLQFNYFT